MLIVDFDGNVGFIVLKKGVVFGPMLFDESILKK